MKKHLERLKHAGRKPDSITTETGHVQRWALEFGDPHLDRITPIQFAQKETETSMEQGSGSGRPAASLRPNLDFLFNLKHIINNYQTNTLCGPVWVT